MERTPSPKNTKEENIWGRGTAQAKALWQRGAWTRMKARVAGMRKTGARSHRAVWTTVQASIFILRKTQRFRTTLSSGVTRVNLLFFKVHFGTEWRTCLKGTPVIRRSEE